MKEYNHLTGLTPYYYPHTNGWYATSTSNGGFYAEPATSHAHVQDATTTVVIGSRDPRQRKRKLSELDTVTEEASKRITLASAHSTIATETQSPIAFDNYEIERQKKEGDFLRAREIRRNDTDRLKKMDKSDPDYERIKKREKNYLIDELKLGYNKMMFERNHYLEERNQIQEKLDALSAQLSMIQQKNDSLSQSNKDLSGALKWKEGVEVSQKSVIAILLQEVKTAQEANQILRQESEDNRLRLEQGIARINDEIKDLNKTHEQTEIEWTKLETKLTRKIADLETGNDHIQGEMRSIQEANTHLQAENKKLQQKIKDLESEKEQSARERERMVAGVRTCVNQITGFISE